MENYNMLLNLESTFLYKDQSLIINEFGLFILFFWKIIYGASIV